MQAACIRCRRGKIKCIRSGSDERCVRCRREKLDCVIPELRMGRQKGAKNKYHGLARARHQIVTAIEQLHKHSLDEQSISILREVKVLLDDVSLSPSTGESNLIPHSTPTPGDSYDDDLSLADAENPLELLAHASQHYSSLDTFAILSPASSKPNSIQLPWTLATLVSKLDVDQEMDPVNLGLASEHEAERLLRFFHDRLAHTRWGIDPSIYTLPLLRSRSLFLLTSMLAAAAKFIPDDNALYRRLSSHVRKLALDVVTHNYRSVEIILALLVNVPWTSPTGDSSDDTCYNVALALKIALDLNLNKTIVAKDADSKLRPEEIPAAKALLIDGFAEVDSSSYWAQKLLRQRERTWICLWALERGVCLARGRDYTAPISPLIQNCDRWIESEHACPWDTTACSIAVLRRDLDILLHGIRRICDKSTDNKGDGGDTARAINDRIENFFNAWQTTWHPPLLVEGANALPPYANILATHTRLSTYGSIMNYRSAPVEARGLFRGDGMRAAVEVMRTAIRSEHELISMPNNTAIMVAYAACIALSLSRSISGSDVKLITGVRSMVEDTANVLERIAQATPHRQGASGLYGNCLRQALSDSSAGSDMRLRPRFAEHGVDDAGKMASQSDPYSISFALSEREMNDLIGTVMTDDAAMMTSPTFENFFNMDWLQGDLDMQSSLLSGL